MSLFAFPAKERLKNKKHISLLFKSGHTLAAFPVLGIYRFNDAQNVHFDPDFPLKVAFSVPKKHFKKAVTRNLIKRRMKEAWRLNKKQYTEFLEKSNLTVQIIIIYIGKEPLTYKSIEKSIKKLLRKLPKHHPKN
ncbi:MAG TPA: ribonuclease P protein component [Saprospiraceae bacterium]|nr:ribonuclease P protein component [Saprospiraceae bacterium]